MRGKLSVSIIIVVIFLGLIAFGKFFVANKNYLSYRLTVALKPALAFVGGVFGETPSPEFKELILENQKLKAQILALSKSSYALEENEREFRVAKIYSSYPFNNRGLVAINAGIKDGVSSGMTATVGGYILLGQVTEVFESYSLVRTIFDAGWELPVKIGSNNTEALLAGGREPELTLILKEKTVKSGEPVYSAGRDFPYGLTLGEVGEIREDVGAAFREASLKLPYDVSTLQEVSVILK